MCISDWRIGRLIRSVAKTATLGANGTLTINGSRQRVGISIAVPVVDQATAVGVSLSQGGVILGVVCNSTPAFMATLQTHGESPTLTLVATELCGNITIVSVIEYFMDESMLTEAKDNFARDYPVSWR